MDTNQIISLLNHLDNIFSNSPLVKITTSYKGKNYRVFGKYEGFGHSSSGKDRIVRHIIKKAYEEGKLKQGETVVEVSSGNTGIALSVLCGLIGNKVKIFIPDWLSKERYALLRLYNAEVITISAEEGGFVEARRLAREFGKKEGYFHTAQFDNPLNVEAHFISTMPELFGGIKRLNKKPVVAVFGYGTGGMVMAAHKFVEKEGINCKVHPLEPANAAFLTEGITERPGSCHKIEGILDDFVPSLLHANLLSKPVVVDDVDAVLLAQKVNKHGISFGISSGANLLGCIKQLHEMSVEEEENVAATIFCDSSLKYCSTDLFNSSLKPNPGSMSPEIEIIDLEIIKDSRCL